MPRSYLIRNDEMQVQSVLVPVRKEDERGRY